MIKISFLLIRFFFIPAHIFLNIYLFKKKLYAFNLSYNIKGNKMVTEHQLKEISIIFNIFYSKCEAFKTIPVSMPWEKNKSNVSNTFSFPC